MEFKFLGCGSAFNPSMGNTSAYFTTENSLFLIDAGESVFTKLYQMKILEKYKHIYIIITHTHADHVGSLPSVISYCYYVLGKSPVVIHPNGNLADLLGKMGIDPDTYEYWQQEQQTADGIGIRAVPVKHAKDLQCFGYLIESEENRFYYSGDSYEVPEEVEQDFLTGGIQAIYQDTTEYSTKLPSHCPLELLERRFPEEFRKNIYCMHFTSDFTHKISEKGFRYVRVEE